MCLKLILHVGKAAKHSAVSAARDACDRTVKQLAESTHMYLIGSALSFLVLLISLLIRRAVVRPRETGHEEPEEVVDGAGLRDAAQEPVERLHREHATHRLAQRLSHRQLQTVQLVPLRHECQHRSLQTLAVIARSAQAARRPQQSLERLRRLPQQRRTSLCKNIPTSITLDTTRHYSVPHLLIRPCCVCASNRRLPARLPLRE